MVGIGVDTIGVGSTHFEGVLDCSSGVTVDLDCDEGCC